MEAWCRHVQRLAVEALTVSAPSSTERTTAANLIPGLPPEAR